MSDELFRKINREFVNLIESVDKHQETLQKLLKKYSECEDSSIDRNFYKQLLENLNSKKEIRKGCSTCEFCYEGSIACETCDTEFTNYEPIDSGKKEILSENLRTCSECQKIFESIKLRKEHEKIIHGLHLHNPDGTLKVPEKKEYIASLNDPKAFEAVNLGTLERTRVKGSKGEKEAITDKEIEEMTGINATVIKALIPEIKDSKLPEPKLILNELMGELDNALEIEPRENDLPYYLPNGYVLMYKGKAHITKEAFKQEINKNYQEQISEFVEFLKFKSSILEGFETLTVFNKQDFEAELEKWEEMVK